MTEPETPKVIGLRGKIVSDGRTPRAEVVEAARDLFERA